MADSAHVASDDEAIEGEVARASAASAGRAAAQPRLWTAVFVLIVLLTFCCFVMGQGLNAGTSVFLSRVGYGASLAGVLALVFSASAAVARLVIGPIIDAGKCSLVMIAGAVVLLAGTVVPLAGQGVALYAASRVLQGVGFAMATTAASTAAADVLPRARLGEGIGYYGLGQALAMSVGPALALFLAGTDPASNLYAGLSLVAVAGLAVSFFTRYERKPLALPETSAFRERWERAKAQAAAAESRAANAEPQAADAKGQPAKAPAAKPAKAPSFFEPRALPGAIPMTIMCPTFGFGIFFVGLYGTQIGVANASLFYTISAISMIAVRLKSKSFMDRVAPIKTFTVAVACGLVTCVMLYFGPASDYVFYLAGVFYGLCLGISLPLNQAVAVKNTPPERWGATNALFLLMNDVGIGLASALWGFTNDAFGFGVTICLVMVCLVASYVAAWVFYPEKDRAWR
ncbi:MFS transporter [Adlercreutzia sp. ZJ473]|uniref:MFS transporter n=1 Tax=Adlercreutzia sp. ZJ473 TaxID=2722822 RepID=UPI001C131BB1|nr:MFS transporter [Adlercreutzia sp. ZJ473]